MDIVWLRDHSRKCTQTQANLSQRQRSQWHQSQRQQQQRRRVRVRKESIVLLHVVLGVGRLVVHCLLRANKIVQDRESNPTQRSALSVQFPAGACASFRLNKEKSEIFISWRSQADSLRMRCSEVRLTWIRSYERNREQ